MTDAKLRSEIAGIMRRLQDEEALKIIKAVLADQREWANPEKAKTEDAHIILSDFLTTLDAYAKDRGIE